MGSERPKVIDLFSGCGGMSWGLDLRGFETIAAIDNWSIALETFQRNHPQALAYDQDIRGLSVQAVLDDCQLVAGELDVMVGGPPCQGFSKNVPAAYRFLEDPRNQLFHDYLRFVEEARPQVVVMENVAEIYNAYDGAVREEICCRLESLGYSVEVKVLTASDYGVPQKRRRCFFLASRTGLEPRIPAPTHAREAGREDSALFAAQEPWVSAWEAIADLPSPSESAEPIALHTNPELSDYQKWARNNAEKTCNHQRAQLQPTQVARYESIGPGEGFKQLPDHLRPKSGYSGAYGRLDFTSPAPTITRWVFHPGSGRFGHPVEPRIITMREAARLQAFTDDFEFVGSRNKIAGQIGNAVPPMLMSHFAPEVLRLLGRET